MKTLKLISSMLVLLICTTIINGCKKYEEGPGLTFKTAKGRITNEWKYKQTVYNGQAPTNGYQQYGMSTYPGDNIDIKKDESYVAESTSGKWSFSSDKESLTLTPNGSSSSDTYTIVKLTSKEMWLEYKYPPNDTWQYRYEKK